MQSQAYNKTYHHSIVRPLCYFLVWLILHTLIRCFEDLFKASCKKIAATEKLSKDEVKKDHQDKFRQDLGLRVFYPQSGGGTSNTGNRARHVFNNIGKSSKILKVNPELMKGLKSLIGHVSSQKEILDPDQFRRTSEHVWKLYQDELQECKPMCPTVHRLLTHGGDFLEICKTNQIAPGSLQ